MNANVTDGDKFEITQTGLTINEDVTYDEWAACGKRLANEYSRIQWAIGDWINFGERKFGEMYSQAEDDTHFSYGTLRNYASICARIPKENRNPKLRFHQIKHVAALEPRIQRVVIEAAVRTEMTGDDVLEAVRKIQGKNVPQSITYEGTVVRWYSQEDGNYFIIRADVNFKVGQQVVIKTKEL